MVELQGFRGLDDGTVAGIEVGLRVAPAICMIWTAVGTTLGSPAVIFSLVPFALLGAVLPGHPFDVVYRVWVRPRIGGAPLPRYPGPRRFACLLASTILLGAGSALVSGWKVTGIVLGTSLCLAAAVNVTTGFCVPSFLLQVRKLLGLPK